MEMLYLHVKGIERPTRNMVLTLNEHEIEGFKYEDEFILWVYIGGSWIGDAIYRRKFDPKSVDAILDFIASELKGGFTYTIDVVFDNGTLEMNLDGNKVFTWRTKTINGNEVAITKAYDNFEKCMKAVKKYIKKKYIIKWRR